MFLWDTPVHSSIVSNVSMGSFGRNGFTISAVGFLEVVFQLVAFEFQLLYLVHPGVFIVY